MASSGDIITWSNFSHVAEYSEYSSGEGRTSPIYVYVSAQAINIHISCNTGWATTTATAKCEISYYDWSTNMWSSVVYTKSGSCKGINKSWDGYIHINAGGLNDVGDDAKHTLWECKFTSTWGNKYCTSRIVINAGGPGCLTEEQYNTFCKGKQIMSAGKLSGDAYYTNAKITTQDRSTAVSTFNYATDRGTQLTADNSKKCVAKWWA